MKIISLKCNSCAADLQINENTKFFNCSFCGSSLALKKSGNAVYTEVLDEIKGNTEAILDTSEKLLWEKQLARLDREWEQQSQAYEWLEEEDNSLVSVIGVTAFAGFIIFFITMMTRQRQNSVHRIFRNQPSPSESTVPVIIVILIVLVLLYMFYIAFNSNNERATAKKEYQVLTREYEEKRAKLLAKIEATH